MSGADIGDLAEAAADTMQCAVDQWTNLIATVTAGGTPSLESRGQALVATRDAQDQIRALADALTSFALQCDAVLGAALGEVVQ